MVDPLSSILRHRSAPSRPSLPSSPLAPSSPSRPGAPSASHADSHFAFHGHYIVPGFIDVHVHGVDGIDALDVPGGAEPVALIADRLPRYGVTAFCPTTVACAPGRPRTSP